MFTKEIATDDLYTVLVEEDKLREQGFRVLRRVKTTDRYDVRHNTMYRIEYVEA